MGAPATMRPAHGGYQDAFAAADMLPLAREIAALTVEQESETAAQIRRGSGDHFGEVQGALAALKWRYYAQPDFRAAVTP